MSYLETPFVGTDLFIETVEYLKSIPKESRPPVLVYGDPDIDGLVSMRKQGGGEQATMSKQEFVDRINAEVEEMLEATNIQPQS